MTNNLRAAIVPPGLPLAPSPVPLRYRGAGLDRVQRPGLRTVLRRYGQADVFWDTAERGIAPCFTGPTGTFKTTAAAVLAEAIHLRFRLPVTWVCCPDVFEALDRQAFAEATARVLEHYRTAPFLVLDDFALTPSGRALDFFRAIVNARYDATLPTAYTANLVLSAKDQQPLVDFAGANVARRILEQSEGFRAAVK